MPYSYPKYPSAIFNDTDFPNQTDDITWIKAWLTNALKEELQACLRELGTNPKGEYGSVKARIEAILSGNERITAETFAIGPGTDVTITIAAYNADENKPGLRYNHTTNKWQYSNDGTTWNDIGVGAGNPKEICFCIPGNAYVTTGISGILVGPNLAGETISKVKIYADTAPTDASLIVDINKNGTTIFTDQGKRPEIAAAAHAGDSDTPDVTALSEGDRLVPDIDQVGSTIAGGDQLYILIVME